MNGQHSILAPSSMGTVMHCPGMPQLARLYPEDGDSQDAREGTASHWAGSEMLEGRDVDVGQVAPNLVTLDLPMIEGADMYVQAVRAVVPVGGHVEQRVDISIIHPFMWGTPDFWYYDAERNILYVFDYKYGRRFVEVFECWQLIAYVAGIIARLRAERAHWSAEAVRNLLAALQVQMTIVQPRSFHRDGPVRTWRTSAPVLESYFVRLAAGADAAVTRDGQYNPAALCHVNHGCRDCTGRRACTTLQRAGMADVDLAGAPVPFDLSPQAVGVELRMIQHAMDQLKARASGLEEQAKSLMMTGSDVPWFRLENGQSREKWLKPVGEIIALGQLLGFDLAKRPEAITPTQARAAGLSADLTAMYAGRTSGELRLVPDDGKMARKVFGQ